MYLLYESNEYDYDVIEELFHYTCIIIWPDYWWWYWWLKWYWDECNINIEPEIESIRSDTMKE